MSDIIQDNKSAEPDFQYDVKFDKREFFTNPGKDRFVVEDSNNDGRKYERGKLGHLRQRDFPIVPSVSMKDVKEVDYNVLNQWRSSQELTTDKLRSSTNNNNANKSITVDDLLLTSGAATQSRDYKSGVKNSQGSILSIGRDLQIRQLLLKSMTKQASLETTSDFNKKIFNNVILKYKSGEASVITNNEDEEKEIENKMLQKKIYSPEPLNDYNSNLLKHLKLQNGKLEKDIDDITDRLRKSDEYKSKFVSLIDINNLDNSQIIEKETSQYNENVINNNSIKLKNVENDMERLDQLLITSINKNLQETTILKNLYTETEKQLNKKLLQTKIFNQKERYKKISGSNYINKYISSNVNGGR